MQRYINKQKFIELLKQYDEEQICFTVYDNILNISVCNISNSKTIDEINLN
jgi:hypothetical protein